MELVILLLFRIFKGMCDQAFKHTKKFNPNVFFSSINLIFFHNLSFPFFMTQAALWMIVGKSINADSGSLNFAAQILHMVWALMT